MEGEEEGEEREEGGEGKGEDEADIPSQSKAKSTFPRFDWSRNADGFGERLPVSSWGSNTIAIAIRSTGVASALPLLAPSETRRDSNRSSTGR